MASLKAVYPSRAVGRSDPLLRLVLIPFESFDIPSKSAGIHKMAEPSHQASAVLTSKSNDLRDGVHLELAIVNGLTYFSCFAILQPLK